MPLSKDFMFRFANKLKELAKSNRPKASYSCSECGATVHVQGEEKKYTCEHIDAAIIGSMSAVAKGHAKLNQR